MRVFISYASEDRELAEQVHLALIGSGYSTFFDKESLPPSGDYHTRIREAVARSDAFVYLISSHSVAPGSYALTELKYARAKWPHPKDRVLPVVTEAISFEKIPVYLKAVTVLEPEGNVAAEVVVALSQMLRSNGPEKEITGLAKTTGKTYWPPTHWPTAAKVSALALVVVAVIVAFIATRQGSRPPGNNSPASPVDEIVEQVEKDSSGVQVQQINLVRATTKQYPSLEKLWCGLPGNSKNPIIARATQSAGAEYSVDTSRHLLLGKDGEPVSIVPAAHVGTLQTRRFLVTHFTAGPSGTENYFMNPQAPVSAHLVIDRDGSVKQLVPFDAAAFHAGRTNWQGITHMNAHSLGIEFENWGRLEKRDGVWYAGSNTAIPAEEVFIHKADGNASPTGWHKYTEQQIKAFFGLTCALRRAYPGLTHLLGHDEISQGRKVDPGPAFPLRELAKRLYLKDVSDPIWQSR